MKDLILSPYFHPTTICFVDDNQSFLESLDLEMPGHWACRTFTDPEVALAYLQEPVPLEPLMDRCFSLHRQSQEALIRLDLNMIAQEINHVDRFRRNSVLVVDYAMPSLNGLEFCQALSDPRIRIAMLTGVADEKLAVEAFNEGLIHRFIPKQSADPIRMVRQFVTELLHEYFNQYTTRLQTTLAISPPAFLVDTQVAAFVHDLMETNNLVEYYLVDDPPGLLMLQSDGRIWRLAFLDPAGIEAQAEVAREFQAPDPVRKKLASGKAVLFLSGLSPGDYFGDETFPWEEHIQPARPLTGPRGEWSVAIWKDAPGDIDFDPATASYDAYRRTF